MGLNDFLRCGYTFTPEEYELETRYVVTTASLVLISLFLGVLGFMYLLLGEYSNALVKSIGVALSFLSIYLGRKVGKENYARLVYLMSFFFLSLILYSYYIAPTTHAVTAWIIIQILASILVLHLGLGMLITGIFTIYIIIMNAVLEYNSMSFVIMKISPVLIVVGLIIMIEKKFLRTIHLLEDANKNLEDKVNLRTMGLQEEKKKLDYQAHYDFLTGIPNRNMFYKEINKWIDEDIDRELVFSLLLIDLDRFKKVNDSLGHDAGDRVLNVMTKRIQQTIGDDAFFSRISGDEFTVLLKHTEKSKRVADMAKRIIQTIEVPIGLENQNVYLSASIGISSYPNNTVIADDLIKYADTTMFEAKKRGKGTFKFYDEKMTLHIQEAIRMDSELHAAIESEALLLYYQPQLDSRTREIIGLEALVRWDHPRLGMISPDRFLSYAEETGVIILLDYFVLEKGMKQVVQWKSEGLDIPRVSFNFSTKHLQNQGFVHYIGSLLDQTGCHGEWIEFEITESHIMENIDEANVLLNDLKALGISIAIDDFGTGYSSLTYLKYLPADKLKIDKSFIAKIPDDKVDMTITNAVIHIAQSIGLAVIAEGVETETQQRYLAQQGCFYIQGFFGYMPLSLEETYWLLMKTCRS